MPETFTPERTWDRAIPPLLAIEAVQTAATAVGMEATRWLIVAFWNEREARYNDVVEAQERLRYGAHPERYFVSAGSPSLAEQEIDVTVSSSSAPFRTTRAYVQGINYGRCRHALDAAAHVIDHGEERRNITNVVQEDPKDSRAESPASERDTSSPAESPPSERDAGMRAWVDRNQGLLAAIGLVLTVVGIVVGIVVS